MLRIMMLPLLLFTLSMACMGQTFQYSRGWTNGKRATAVSSLGNAQLRRADDENIVDVLEAQNYEHKYEKCLQFLQRYLSNALLRRAAEYGTQFTTLNSNLNNNRNKPNLSNDNNQPHLFMNHHQSQDLFDELGGGGGAGTAAIETGDGYNKH